MYYCGKPISSIPSRHNQKNCDLAVLAFPELNQHTEQNLYKEQNQQEERSQQKEQNQQKKQKFENTGLNLRVWAIILVRMLISHA